MGSKKNKKKSKVKIKSRANNDQLGENASETFEDEYDNK
jgi:hypothetical protein